MNILYDLFGYVMRFCCTISANNYIFAVFFFSLIVEIVLFPLSIKQQKNSVKTASLRPKEQAIRKKYAGRTDKATQQKMSLEINEMYQKEGYNSRPAHSFRFRRQEQRKDNLDGASKAYRARIQNGTGSFKYFLRSAKAREDKYDLLCRGS